MKNISLIIPIFATLMLTYACQKNEACLLPEGGCNCPEGYTGSDCDIKVTTKFLGLFRKFANDTSKLTVTDSSNYTKRVFFYNYNDFNRSGSFYGIVDGDHVIIPRQPSLKLPTYFKYVEGDACITKTLEQSYLIFNLRFDDGQVITRTQYFRF